MRGLVAALMDPIYVKTRGVERIASVVVIAVVGLDAV